MSRIIIGSIIFICVVVAGIIATQPRPEAVPTIVGSPLKIAAPNFSLKNQNGRTVTMSGQRGHVVILAFFYTHCADICPMTAQKIRTVLNGLGPEATKVRVLIVSTDPFGDTPARARQWLKTYGQSNWDYLLGSYKQLKKVWADYYIAASTPAEDRAGKQSHQAFMYLINQQGQTTVTLGDSATPGESISLDLHILLDDHKWSLASTVAAQVGAEAPTFVLPRLHGGTVNLQGFRGRPVLVNFWATNCGPCRREMPLLERTFRHFKGRLSIIGVDTQEPVSEVAPYVHQVGVTYPIALDKDGNVSLATYDIFGTPETFFIDRKGIIKRATPGDLSASTIDAQVEQLMRS